MREMGDAAGKLADGAGELDSGVGDLADGAGQLSDNSGELVDGAGGRATAWADRGRRVRLAAAGAVRWPTAHRPGRRRR